MLDPTYTHTNTHININTIPNFTENHAEKKHADMNDGHDLAFCRLTEEPIMKKMFVTTFIYQILCI
jgi:hypothetical protein